MYQINDELKEFIESGLQVMVGTADMAGNPASTNGWGPYVHDDGRTLSVFLDEKRAGRTLANLGENGKVAVLMADPISYRSIQLKGRYLPGKGAVSAADRRWVDQHRQTASSTLALVGDSTAAIRNMWMEELVRIDVSVESAFDQTPGVQAGRTL